jgi:hypothetical protein
VRGVLDHGADQHAAGPGAAASHRRQPLLMLRPILDSVKIKVLAV